jgi:hypothetical protein
LQRYEKKPNKIAIPLVNSELIDIFAVRKNSHADEKTIAKEHWNAGG